MGNGGRCKELRKASQMIERVCNDTLFMRASSTEEHPVHVGRGKEGDYF